MTTCLRARAAAEGAAMPVMMFPDLGIKPARETPKALLTEPLKNLTEWSKGTLEEPLRAVKSRFLTDA